MLTYGFMKKKYISPNCVSKDDLKNIRFHAMGAGHWQLEAKHISLATSLLCASIPQQAELRLGQRR